MLGIINVCFSSWRLLSVGGVGVGGFYLSNVSLRLVCTGGFPSIEGVTVTHTRSHECSEPKCSHGLLDTSHIIAPCIGLSVGTIISYNL